MNLSNAWENFSNIYSSFSLAYFSVKRAEQVVNTVNHSLVLPELFSAEASAPKRLHLFTTAQWVQSRVKFLNRLKIYNASTVHCVNFTAAETSQNKTVTLKRIDRILSSDINHAYALAVTAVWCEGDKFTSCMIFAGSRLSLSAADTLPPSMTCHHHPDRPTVAAPRHTQPANPISFPMMTVLRRRDDTL